MLERRDARAGGRYLGGIDLRHDNARFHAAFGDDAAPRIDDEGMAEGLAAVLVLTACAAAKTNEPFSMARARRSMPVRLASLLGEGGGYGEEGGARFGERAIKCWKRRS
jgi:hypothetical protein